MKLPCAVGATLVRAIAMAAMLAAPEAFAQSPGQAVPPPPQLSTLPAAAAPAPERRPAVQPAPLAAAASAPGAARAASAPAAAASSARLSVLEDDAVRIEEVRGPRGQLLRVVVHPKNGGKPYELIVPQGGKDSSQQPRGATGQSAWSLFDW